MYYISGMLCLQYKKRLFWHKMVNIVHDLALLLRRQCGIMEEVSDFKFEISDLRFQISDLRFQIENLRSKI